jgi:hypothetical protein
MAKLAFYGLVLSLALCRSLLVGNYRLWDSWGEVLYDFGESQNHGRIVTQPDSVKILTDRGLYLSKASISLPKSWLENTTEGSSIWLAFWYLPLHSSNLLAIEAEDRLVIYVELSNQYLNFMLNSFQESVKYLTQIEKSNI